MMKKTLVALAVAAASGATFAQVTLSGDFEYGYAQSHAKNTAGVFTDKGGIGVDTSELYFDAVEDLGGGMKIAAHMGLIGADRTGESSGAPIVQGEDGKLTLSGNFGSTTLGSIRNGDYLNGVTGAAAAPGMDGKIQGTRTYRDVIIYNTPELIPGLTAQVYWGEPNYQGTSIANDSGLGAGSLGSSAQRKEIYSLNYAKGPIKANLGYVTLDNTTGAATSTLGTKGVRGGASYDAGVVLVGAGFDYETLENGNDNTYMLNANIPFGQFSFGVDYASRQYSGVASNAVGTRTGYGLGARYQLSKTAAIWAQYWNYLDNVTSTENTTGFEVAIAKSF